jgi:hypothetical protein
LDVAIDNTHANKPDVVVALQTYCDADLLAATRRFSVVAGVRMWF